MLKHVSVDELRKEYDRRRAEISGIQNDISDIKRAIDDNMRDAAKAAAAGQELRYVELQKQIREDQDRITAKTIRIKALEESLPAEDLRAAWDVYRRSADAEAAALLTALHKSRRELADAFRKIMTAQKAAYITQALMTAYSGHAGDNNYALQQFPFRMFDMSDFAAEIQMLQRTGELNAAESAEYGGMLVTHKV